MIILNKHIGRYFIAALSLVTIAIYGCNADKGAEAEADPAIIVLQTRVSVNPTDIDNYVTKVRVIGFGRDDGTLACNTLHTTLQPTADGALVFTEQVRRTGINLYIIANETAAMTSVLDHVYKESDFLALDAVSKIEFVPGWEPSKNAPFLMSEYVAVDIPADANTTLEVPVSLKRMQAKLTFSLKNEYVATQEQNGKSYESRIKVDDVRIETVPKYQLAVKPRTNYSYQYLPDALRLTLDTGDDYYEDYAWEDTYKNIYLPENLLTDNDPEMATAVCFTATRSFVNVANTDEMLPASTTYKHYRVPIQAPLDSGEGMDYSVHRNYHYNMQCSITKWDEGPVVTSEVVPWDFRVIEVDFDTPEFEVQPVDAVIQDGHPVVAGVGGGVTYSMRLTGPKGAWWRATISNGLDFEFASDEGYVQLGYVSPYVTWMVRVVSKNEWMEGTPRVTDLVFMVNEKEVYRIKDITVVNAL